MATPTLVQHVASAMEQILGGTFTFNLPNPVLSQNAIILGVQYSSGAGITVSGGGNTWNSGPAADNGTRKMSSFYVQSAVAGTQTITVAFTGTPVNVQFVISEWYNVSLSVGSLFSSSSSTSISAGAFTATVGDLIWHWATDFSNTTVSNQQFNGGGGGGYNGTTVFTAGAGFTLMSVDNQVGSVEQYQVATSTAINPTGLVQQRGAWASVAFALHSAAAGTAPSSAGIRVVGIQHTLLNSGEQQNRTTNTIVQFPSQGNLLVACYQGGANNISSIPPDSLGNAWVQGPHLAGGSLPTTQSIWYVANANTGSTLSGIAPVTATDASIDCMFDLYDIVGASSTPFDVGVTNNGNNSSGTTGIALLTISPTTAHGLVIITENHIFGTITALNSSPAGAIFDSFVNSRDNNVNPPGGTPPSGLDEDGTVGHLYNNAAGAISFSINTTSVLNQWVAAAAAFKAAVVTGNTYFVSPTGNDANTGLSTGTAWRTIGHAASVASGGDTVNIAAATYTEAVTWSHSGTGGNPITFNGVPGTILIAPSGGGLQVVTGSWVVLNGITINTPYGPGSTASAPNNFLANAFCYGLVDRGGNNVYNNCIWQGAAALTSLLGGPDHGDFGMFTAQSVFGSSNTTLTNCIFRNWDSCDATSFAFGISNCTFKGCIFYNCTWNTGASHPDCFQTNPGTNYNGIVIDSCYFHDLVANSIFEWQGTGSPGTIFRNNVVVNTTTAILVLQASGLQVYNNTFYDCGTTYQEAIEKFQNDPGVGAVDNIKVQNNIIVGTSTGYTGYIVNGPAPDGGTPTNYVETNNLKANGASISANFIGPVTTSPSVAGNSLGFQLTSSSLARAAAVTLSPAFPDAAGKIRSIPWDIGAYAFTAAAPTNIQFVQGPIENRTVTSNTISVSYPVGTLPGDALVVFVGAEPTGTSVVTTPTDSIGNTFVAVPTTINAQGFQIWCYYCPSNIASIQTGDTVSVTVSNTSFVEIVLYEFSFTHGIWAVDQFMSNSSASSAAMTTGSVITGQDNEAIVTYFECFGTPTGTFGNSTVLPISGNLSQYLVTTTAGSYTGTATQTPTTKYAGMIVTFSATGAVNLGPTSLQAAMGLTSAKLRATLLNVPLQALMGITVAAPRLMLRSNLQALLGITKATLLKTGTGAVNLGFVSLRSLDGITTAKLGIQPAHVSLRALMGLTTANFSLKVGMTANMQALFGITSATLLVPSLIVPITVATSGFYIVLDAFGIYPVLYLAAGVNYAGVIQQTLGGPYTTYLQGIIALVNMIPSLPPNQFPI